MVQFTCKQSYKGLLFSFHSLSVDTGMSWFKSDDFLTCVPWWFPSIRRTLVINYYCWYPQQILGRNNGICQICVFFVLRPAKTQFYKFYISQNKNVERFLPSVSRKTAKSTFSTFSTKSTMTSIRQPRSEA